LLSIGQNVIFGVASVFCTSEQWWALVFSPKQACFT